MLRINNNSNGILNSLRQTQKAQAKSLSMLASGKRINKGSDDPAGLIISETLRAAIAGLTQASENTQQNINVMNIAEAGMGEIQSMLTEARSLAIASANTGFATKEMISANQQQIDSIMRSVDRIAGTTRFGSRALLDGSQAIKNTPAGNIANLNITDAAANTSGQTFTVDITQVAAIAQTTDTIAAAQVGDAQIEIRGETGAALVQVTDGMTQAQIADAINAVSENTGVQVNDATFVLESTDVGSTAEVTVKTIEGSGITGVADITTTGTDTTGSVNGMAFTAEGNAVSFDVAGTRGTFTNTATTPSSSQFTVGSGGMAFQLTDSASGASRVGISGMSSGQLGMVNMNMRSYGASAILGRIDEAISRVSSQRASLGAYVKNSLAPNVNSLAVAIENITATESSIRDADIAEAVTLQTKNQIKQQIGIFSMKQKHSASQNILRLLGQ